VPVLGHQDRSADLAMALFFLALMPTQNSPFETQCNFGLLLIEEPRRASITLPNPALSPSCRSNSRRNSSVAPTFISASIGCVAFPYPRSNNSLIAITRTASERLGGQVRDCFSAVLPRKPSGLC
jgi:hypothetical protein